MAVAIVKAIILCESVSTDPILGKQSLLGVIDRIAAVQYPPILRGSVFVTLADVSEGFELRIEILGYGENPLAAQRSVLGTVQIPPRDGETVSAFITGNLTFPVAKAGKADIFIYADGEYLDHRSIMIVDPPGQPGATAR